VITAFIGEHHWSHILLPIQCRTLHLDFSICCNSFITDLCLSICLWMVGAEFVSLFSLVWAMCPLFHCKIAYQYLRQSLVCFCLELQPAPHISKLISYSQYEFLALWNLCYRSKQIHVVPLVWFRTLGKKACKVVLFQLSILVLWHLSLLLMWISIFVSVLGH
jgi:hypothetical protein